MLVIGYIKRTWAQWAEEDRIIAEKCRKGRALIKARQAARNEPSGVESFLRTAFVVVALFVGSAIAWGAIVHAKDVAVEELNARFPRQR